MLLRAERFLSQLKRQKSTLLFAGFVLSGQALLVVLSPLPLKMLIDGVLMNNHSALFDAIKTAHPMSDHSMLLFLIGIIGVLAMIGSTLDYFEEMSTNLASSRLIEGIRQEMIQLLLSRNFSSLERRRKIDLLGRISGDTANLEILITSGLGVVVRSIPTILMVLASMIIIDWRFSLILGSAVPVMYYFASKYSTRLRREQKAFRSETNHFEQDTHQAIDSIQLIKSLSIENVTAAALGSRVGRITDVLLDSRKSQGALVASLSGTRNLVRMLVLLIGGIGALRGDFSVGNLVLFLAYTDALGKPINEITNLTSKYTKATVSIERVEELFHDLNPEAEVGGTRCEYPQPTAPVDLELRSVSFGYSRAPLLLNQFSARFNPGEIVALIGPSGAGKSSMVKLMNRLIDPTEGLVQLGGANMTSFDLGFLRHQVTVIPQNSFFLHGSVRYNLQIAVGQPVSDEKIWEALRRVNAEDFVRGLPVGLDTVIGEGGKKLSGGQERRLSIARAFLREDSAVYVFDEATSGLDPHSSRVIVDSVEKLAARGALVLWVTHRLEEVAHAHSVLYFRQGMNPILSSHRDLLNTHISYRNYFVESGHRQTVGPTA